MISFSKNLSLVLFLFVFSTVSSVGTGTTYTFTNAGATGNTGPTQSEINLSYVNTNLEDGVTITQQGFQEWNVPTTGTYVIEALGASGGSSSSSNRLGGKGAKIKGTFDLTAGTTLKIVVGQEGLEGTRSGGKDYGGGGGTFVLLPPYNSTDSLLVVAGGGGGAAGSLSTSGNLMGNDATQATNGTSGISSNPGVGGTNGSGGTVSSGNAGAGAGFLANGGGNISSASGKSISNGALGGFNQLDSGIGGFGGGGGGWHYGGHGGGGGGFSGGGTGGSGYYGGGGGGSFNSGTSQENHSGFNQGHGKVIITLVSFETFTFTNAGANGREGPTQSQIDSNYSGTNLAGKVTINTRGIQEWTVPASGNYAIEVWGAQGGRGGIDDPVVEGGKGAKMKGIFSLSANTKIKILVGQKGLGGGDDKGGGGGGGSFVTSETNIPLIVAGGGGGGSYHATHGPGVDSRIGGNGNIQIATTTVAGSSANASGGAGFQINSTPGNGAGIAYSFINGAIGALGEENHDGGFGGGGGGDNSYPSGGGGGGYKGGNASGTNWNQSIGQSKGGFSYNAGISQENSSTLGYNTGHGKVIITLVSFETFTFTNAGATGREGPTQSQIDSNYSGTNLAGKVTINTRGIQEWTVPSDGNYKIEAYGAAGGPAAQSNSPVWFGKGSYISGRFDFAQGQTLKILVGQTVTGTNSDGGGAGGGGSFVVTSNDTPLIVAGGGGGGSDHRVNSSAILDSTTANRGLSYNPSGRDIYGGAGGGFSSYKESSVNHGQSFLQGGKGGLGSKLEGGFGGGGGHSSTGNKWGAGGGGYSGGSETNGESFFQGHEGGGVPTTQVLTKTTLQE